MRFSVPSEGEGAVVLGPKCMFSPVSLLIIIIIIIIIIINEND